MRSQTCCQKHSGTSRHGLKRAKYRCAGPSLAAVVCHADGATAKSKLRDVPFRIYWDLDNIRPTSSSLATTVLAHRIKAAVEALGCDVASFSAYANTRTFRTLESAAALLQAGGLHVVQVQPTPDAADLRLMTDAYLFAKQNPRASGVVIVSGDTGNAPLLAHLTSLGVATVCIAPFGAYYRKAWKNKVQPLRLHSVKMAAACNVAMVWNPHDGLEVSADECEYAMACSASQQLHGLSATTSAVPECMATRQTRGVRSRQVLMHSHVTKADMTAVKGSVTAVWHNTKEGSIFGGCDAHANGTLVQ